MRIRLRLLLTSFNKTVMDYTLARLEVALANHATPAPPVVNRLGPYARNDDEFATKWPTALAQVGAAAAYLAAGNRGTFDVKRDLAWARLARAVKMVAQFAESIDCLGAEPKTSAAGDDAG